MGDVTDIGALLKAASREKRRKLLWAACTSVGTIVATTATVSWKMSRYVANMEAADERRAWALLVMDKKIEKAETDASNAVAEAGVAKVMADKALLYAQLTQQKRERP